MKIVQLTAQNVKGLRAIDITPDPTMQVIGGRNAQGKSSVLDAIWLALGGGKASKETSRPVRDGEERAQVTLDLGAFIVTRTWMRGGASTSLRVESRDGARYPSPQAILDGLVGRVAFDPLAFTRLSAREQREALLHLIDLNVDLDALEADRARLYQQRTELGRQIKALGCPTVDETLPTAETPLSDLLAEARRVQEHNTQVGAARVHLDESMRARDDAQAEVERLEEMLREAEARLRQTRTTVEDAITALEQAGPRIDPSDVESQMQGLEQRNAEIRENNQARETRARAQDLEQQVTDLTVQITRLDEAKGQALQDASFPIPGLGFDAHGVTYQGVPFAQASSAEQIRVSVAMAMAANPELRVLRIMDGSLLDDDAMQALREQVQAADYQLWIERVGDGDRGAVIIEDGEVRP